MKQESKYTKMTALFFVQARRFFGAHKKIFSTGLGLAIVVLLVSVQPAQAQASSFIENIAASALKNVVGFFVDIYIYVAGGLLTSILVPNLVALAQFNDFTNNNIVVTGWTITRDIANMFFIVVLLIIAFSTMLRVQTYHYKQTLVKLLIMAVLVNFSKVISGVFIDFFQILMLWFVNGFASVAGGNIIAAFHIYDMLAIAYGGDVIAGGQIAGGATSDLALTGTLILAAVGVTVVVITVLIFIVVLAFRMVMLWILVILSPLAYFAYTIRPQYWSQWWGEFFKHLISGPAIAFFLWLALLTSQTTSLQDIIQDNGAGADIADVDEAVQAGEGAFLSEFAKPGVMMNFLAMTALMIGGMVVSQKMASGAGGAAGAIAGNIRKGGMKALAVGTGGTMLRKPYDWGASRVKSFNKMRENTKADRASESARTMMNVYGGLKQKTVGLVGKGLQIGKSAAADGLAGLTGMEKRGKAQKKLEELNKNITQAEQIGDYDKVREYTGQRDALTRNLKVRSFVSRWNPLANAINKMAEAGQAEKRAAFNAKWKEVSNFGDEVKDLTSGEQKAIWNDTTQARGRRVAAAQQLIKEKNVGSYEEAQAMVDEMKIVMGNDPAVNKQLESMLGKAYGRARLEDKTDPSQTKSVLKVKLDYGERLADQSVDDVKDARAITDVYRDKDNPGVLQTSSFTNSMRDMARNKVDAMQEALREVAHWENGAKTKDANGDLVADKPKRRVALQALAASGDLENAIDYAKKNGFSDDEIQSLLREVFSDDQKSVVENVSRNAGNISMDAILELGKGDSNNNFIMSPKAIREMVDSWVYRQAKDGRQNWERWRAELLKTLSTGTDEEKAEVPKAAARLLSHTGDPLKLFTDKDPDTGERVDNPLAAQKDQILKMLAKDLKDPAVLSKLRAAELSDDDRRLLVEEGLRQRTLTADTIIPADNELAKRQLPREQLNAILKKIEDVVRRGSDDTGEIAASVKADARSRSDVSDIYRRINYTGEEPQTNQV